MTPHPRFALLGHPVGHSISPTMMQPALDLLAPGARYEAADVAPGRLRGTLSDLAARGYSGFNLTHPHKVVVASMVERLSTAARRCGAINCVAVEDHGRLTGYNTDLGGIRYVLGASTRPPARSCSWGPGARPGPPRPRWRIWGSPRRPSRPAPRTPRRPSAGSSPRPRGTPGTASRSPRSRRASTWW